jgi:hypothetical protein
MKVATNLALSGALMFWMAAFAQEAVKPVAAPAPATAAATAAATAQQECGKMMEKMHASDKAGMKSGEMMKSGCMNKNRKPAETSAKAEVDEHDHSAHAHK